MASTDALIARLSALRLGFDGGFALPMVEKADDLLDVLMIRVGRDPYALRLAQLAALEADRTITPVPSEHGELIGVAGMRGAVVAVFDLAAVLGAPRPEATRWLVLVKGAPLAFAFSGFERQLSLRPDELARSPAAHGGAEVVVRDGMNVPLLDLPALITGLEGRTRRTHGEG
jgi:chemotaxis signal transduction protein